MSEEVQECCNCDYGYQEEPVKQLQLEIGQVRIISMDQPIPAGWRKLVLFEAQKYKDQLSTMLGDWSIVGFQGGKLDGAGYGNKIMTEHGSQCGELFIVSGGAGAAPEPKTEE